MASHGGYREPKNPAQVSGPGAMSKRTDGGQVSMDLPDAKYGENADYQDIQSGAPVASNTGPSPQTQSLFGQLQAINAASSQPGTPVTDGAQYGPGQDSSALPANNPKVQEAQQLASTGVLKLMIQVADSDQGTPAFRSYVRSLLAALPTQ